jgi:3-methyladenine DNA glycosylase AlkD
MISATNRERGNTMDFVMEQLLEHQDETYGQFQRKLLPTIEPAKIIGVRTPVLRNMAKQLKEDARRNDFLSELPHTCFEENLLHGIIISENADFQSCIDQLERFLPYMDNWAVCDQTSPKVFKKHREALLPYIRKWLTSEHVYTVRFAIGMLMRHFLEDDFKQEYLDMVTGIQSGEYYINMEIAWYMATALAKQWEAAIPYLEAKTMDKWVHNRTIQKARESYRITAAQKEYLKTLKK